MYFKVIASYKLNDSTRHRVECSHEVAIWLRNFKESNDINDKDYSFVVVERSTYYKPMFDLNDKALIALELRWG